jgi:predicted dehydrogenase
VEVLADITTTIPIRRKPLEPPAGTVQGEKPETFQSNPDRPSTSVPVKVEDLASVLLRFDNGARGSFSVGQVCAGHKNDLRIEVCGSAASVAWSQERQNELWIGRRDRASAVLQKDPSLLDKAIRSYAHLPGGHQESWADAFCNIMRDIYGVIAAGKGMTNVPPAFATFADGYRANLIVDAILESARRGSVWTPCQP